MAVSSAGLTPLPRSARPEDAGLLRTTALGIVVLVVFVIGIPGYARVVFGVLSLQTFVAQFAMTGTSIAIVLVALTLVFRWRLRRGRSPRESLLDTLWLAPVVQVPLYLVCLEVVRWIPESGEPGAPLSTSYYVATAIADGLPMVIGWAAVVLYPMALASADERAREAEALRREAELLRLRASLEPHFVLNTLNTIAGLVGQDPRHARALLGDLGDLFRDAVRDGSADHPLDDELRWLERYGHVLSARHPDLVTLRVEADGPARATRVPRLLLQPLVENAAEHGLLRNERGGEILVRATLSDDSLQCEVIDDGPGFPEKRREGARGLEIVERRLALASPGASLTFGREEGRTVVRVVMPVGAAR